MRLKPLDVYTDLFVNYLTGGDLNTSSKISSIGMRTSYGMIATQNKIRKVWVIKKVPNEMHTNLTEAIRYMMRSFGEVHTIITQHNEPKRLPISTSAFDRLRRKANVDYENYKATFDTLSDSEKETGIKIRGANKSLRISKERLEQLRMSSFSYNYAYIHQTDGGYFMRTTMTIEAIFDTNPKIYKREAQKELVDKYTRTLEDLLMSIGVSFSRISANTSGFMESYGVCGYKMKKNEVGSFLMPDKGMADNSLRREMGLIGGSGILMGYECRTLLPLWIDFFGSSNAQVNLVYGKTGSGKTMLCFQIALQCIIEGAHCLVLDIKGQEWGKLTKYIPNAKIISMGGDEGNFVNTLRLDDLDIEEEESAFFYNNAVSSTVNLLSTMVQLKEHEGSQVDLQSHLKNIVSKTLSQHKVYSDKLYSFGNTKKMKLSDIYPVLKEYKTGLKKGDRGYQMLEIIETRCEPYIGPQSDNRFKNEISLSEILESPLVIFSFGKNSGAMLDIEDNVKVFMAQYLDMKKQSIRKSKKLQSVSFYEEIQRCAEIGNLTDYFRHTVTGSRSNNVAIFLLINSLEELNTSKMSAIKASITTKILGATNENDKRMLVENYGCKDIEDLLDTVAKAQGKREYNYQYDHAFVIDYNTGQKDDLGNAHDVGVFKCCLPPDMLEHLNTKDTMR